MSADRVMVARLREARSLGVTREEANRVLVKAAAGQAKKGGWGRLMLTLTLQDIEQAVEAAYAGRQSNPKPKET